jgi:SAM-dependent methyltransferase
MPPSSTTTGGSTAGASADLWPGYARRWRLLGPPLRPVAEDVDATLQVVRAWCAEHPNEAPRALLLGVTPELATMDWPAGTSLVAADRAEPMIAVVLPKEGVPEGTRAVCTDWRALPLEDGSVDVVVGDGCFTVFDFPGEVRAFAREVRRVMAPGARFAVRVFMAPGERESLEAIERDLRAGEIGNFHCLKWRVAMAVQPSADEGVALGDIHEAYGRFAPIVADLTVRSGFEPEVVGLVEAYRGSRVRYSFPTVTELREALADVLEVAGVLFKSYELGDRCPTLVLRPR